MAATERESRSLTPLAEGASEFGMTMGGVWRGFMFFYRPNDNGVVFFPVTPPRRCFGLEPAGNVPYRLTVITVLVLISRWTATVLSR